MPIEPVLTHRTEHNRTIPMLVWRLPEPVLAISSAVLGGGIAPCRWVVNATVPMSYDRPDPARHLREIAAGLDLDGPGVGLLTGVDVAHVVAAGDGDVRLWSTVGLGAPIQAAAPPASERPPGEPSASEPRASKPRASEPRAKEPQAKEPRADKPPTGSPMPGTVNIVAWVPHRLGDGALVNAVATITEAKTQAIRDLGLDATGTATDAVCVLCPLGGPVAEYAGPRSAWGARVARAAYRAVLDGGARNRKPWSDQ